MTAIYRAGIVGAGQIGRAHAVGYQGVDSVEIVAVTEPNDQVRGGFMELDEIYVEDDEDMIPLPEMESTETTLESGPEETPKKADEPGLAATDDDDEEPRLEED